MKFLIVIQNNSIRLKSFHSPDGITIICRNFKIKETKSARGHRQK